MQGKIAKYGGNELDYIRQVLDSDLRSATGGSWNKRLEAAFAKKIQSRYAIAQNSGTSALHSCLAAAGIGPGDEVISPALTVIMDTFAILYQGATPVYADIDPETFNIDPKDVERKITKKTKAIITVSLYGLSADMDPILKIAHKNNIVVIEDNAQCVLGTYKGKIAGSIGDMAIFSFENSKHISVGEGGIVTTNNEHFAEKIRKFGGIGYKNLRAEDGRIKLDESVFQNPTYKRHDMLGWNYRMPEVCAAIGVAQVERLEDIIARRQYIASIYADAIKECSWLIPQTIPKEYTHSFYTFATCYEGQEKINISWEKFYQRVKENGGDGFYAAWCLPYEEPAITKNPIYAAWSQGISCPIAKKLQAKMMQFKTNYRDNQEALFKINILKQTIRELEQSSRESR